MELREIIEQAYVNGTIDYISYEQKEELREMHREIFGCDVDILCPRCIFKACIDIEKHIKEKEEYGGRKDKR